MILSKRARAIILSGIMLFTIIFSSLLIIVDSNHDCTVEDCRICQTIQLFMSKFKELGNGEENVALSAFCVMLFAVLSFSLIFNDNFSTLVTQKIKLSI